MSVLFILPVGVKEVSGLKHQAVRELHILLSALPGRVRAESTSLRLFREKGRVNAVRFAWAMGTVIVTVTVPQRLFLKFQWIHV